VLTDFSGLGVILVLTNLWHWKYCDQNQR